MKKLAILMTICVMTAGLAACSGEETQPDAIQGESVVATAETPASEEQIPVDPPVESQIQESQVPESTAAPETEQAETSESTPAGQESAAGEFEDNFAVENETAAAFAQQIKDAVAAQDLEALADLTAFPVYVGFTDGGQGVETREDFVALGAEKIFTPELVDAMANATKTEFTPSMAGFTVSDGRPNITFGVVDGSLGIVGINY